MQAEIEVLMVDLNRASCVLHAELCSIVGLVRTMSTLLLVNRSLGCCMLLQYQLLLFFFCIKVVCNACNG